MPAIPLPDSQQQPNTTTLPIRKNKHAFPVPLLRLQLHDLAHEGSSVFLSNTHGNEDLALQVQNVLNLLYTPSCARPGTRSVTFVLRSCGGVAYTTGSDLDADHKEIHISLDYVRAQGGKVAADARHELLGVVCHELVHCFQWNALGSAPGGLIEGIADWVRLNAGLAAKHWKREAGGKWDGGYQHTGYFLQWLEGKFGEGTIRKLNGQLRESRYEESKLWPECCGGKKVGELWEEYAKEVGKKEEEGKESAAVESEGNGVTVIEDKIKEPQSRSGDLRRETDLSY